MGLRVVCALLAGQAAGLMATRRSAPPRRLTVRHVDVTTAVEVVTGLGAVAMAYTAFNEDRQDEAVAARKAEEAARLERRRAKAAIEPRDAWRETDLKPYDGKNYDGPILLAADGLVFNVWKGRHFYAPDGPYHSMAGRDATRQLAKNRLDDDEDYPPDDGAPLTLAEEAALQAWVFSFKNKYDVVGPLVKE